MKKNEEGTLYLVATPIGNDDDISLRAVKILKLCDTVVCEEGKMGARLLHQLRVTKPIEELNEHNEDEQTQHLLELLREGKTLALISDAGTPLLADPGLELVRQSLQEEIPVVAVPGASSIMTALVTSGLPVRQFLFAGFLPREPGERLEELELLAQETRTVVLLETPYRLQPLLAAAAKVMPTRRAYLGCNLTMPSETHHYGTVDELAQKFTENKFKGEFVFVFAGNDEGQRPVRRAVATRQRAFGNGPRVSFRSGERREGSKPFERREGSGKPFERREGSGKPFERREGGGKPFERREGGGKPFERREGGGKPFERREGGGKPFARREGGGKPFERREGGGKPFERREGGGKPFERREGGGKPFERREGSGKPFERREGGGKPFERREGGGKPFERREGGGKPFERREGGKPFEGGGKPFERRGAPGAGKRSFQGKGGKGGFGRPGSGKGPGGRPGRGDGGRRS